MKTRNESQYSFNIYNCMRWLDTNVQYNSGNAYISKAYKFPYFLESVSCMDILQVVAVVAEVVGGDPFFFLHVVAYFQINPDEHHKKYVWFWGVNLFTTIFFFFFLFVFLVLFWYVKFPFIIRGCLSKIIRIMAELFISHY